MAVGGPQLRPLPSHPPPVLPLAQQNDVGP